MSTLYLSYNSCDTLLAMASTQPQFGSTQGAGPSDSSSFSTPSAQRTMNPSGSGPAIPARATSPSKQPEAKAANVVKNDRPIDIRVCNALLDPRDKLMR
jgi:hypothetical protein